LPVAQKREQIFACVCDLLQARKTKKSATSLDGVNGAENTAK